MPRPHSRYLLNERPLAVPPSLARMIGLDQALVLQTLHDRLAHSEHTHDGHLWVPDTYTAWQEDYFPFWSIQVLQRLFTGLEALGLVRSGQYNTHKTDRRKWYTIDYGALDALYTVPSDSLHRWGSVQRENRAAPTESTFFKNEECNLSKSNDASLPLRLKEDPDLKKPPREETDLEQEEIPGEEKDHRRRHSVSSSAASPEIIDTECRLLVDWAVDPPPPLPGKVLSPNRQKKAPQRGTSQS